MESSVELLFSLLLGIQFFHSIEELSTGFHKVFPPMKMSFRTFLTFEIVFFSFWTFVFFNDDFAGRIYWMRFFNLLMFVNGTWHIVWAVIVKKYVPGLVTAPLFVIVFAVIYFKETIVS